MFDSLKRIAACISLILEVDGENYILVADDDTGEVVCTSKSLDGVAKFIADTMQDWHEAMTGSKLKAKHEEWGLTGVFLRTV